MRCGGKGHPYADYTRPIDKGKAAEKNLMVKRSMVATIEAPRVGPWQIGRIQTSNDKTWTIRLGTRRLRSVQVSIQCQDWNSRRNLLELATLGSTYENIPVVREEAKG